MTSTTLAFTYIWGNYNEMLLNNKLVNNVAQFLLGFGTELACIGKEHRLQIDVKGEGTILAQTGE